MGSFLTTLIKVDKSLVLYKYKDKSCTSYINRPNQIPDTPSRMREFFFGKYRPKSESQNIWMEVKIGINIDPETFFADARCLLEDRAGREDFIFKKDLQAEITSEIVFFYFQISGKIGKDSLHPLKSKSKTNSSLNQNLH